MSIWKKILLLPINFIFCTSLLAQDSEFIFEEDLLESNHICEITIYERFVVLEDDPEILALDSKYGIDKKGRIINRLYYGFIISKKRKIENGLFLDSIRYDLSENKKEIRYYIPNKLLKYNPNKKLKNRIKIEKKIDKVIWQEKPFREVFEYGEDNKLKKQYSYFSQTGERFFESEYIREISEGGKNEKKYTFPFTDYIDSLIYYKDSIISYYLIDGKVSSKEKSYRVGEKINKKEEYDLTESGFHLVRTYLYNEKEQIKNFRIYDNEEVYFYNVKGLLEKVEYKVQGIKYKEKIFDYKICKL